MRSNEPIKFNVTFHNRPEYPKQEIVEESKKEPAKENTINGESISLGIVDKSIFKNPESYTQKVKSKFEFLYKFGKSNKSINLCVDSCMVDFKKEFYEIIKRNIKDSDSQKSILNSKEYLLCIEYIENYLIHMFTELPNDKNEAYSIILAKTILSQTQLLFKINDIDLESLKCIFNYIIAFFYVLYPQSVSNL